MVEICTASVAVRSDGDDRDLNGVRTLSRVCMRDWCRDGGARYDIDDPAAASQQSNFSTTVRSGIVITVINFLQLSGQNEQLKQKV